MKHYLIFEGVTGSHSYVSLVRAPDPLAAIRQLLKKEDGDLTFEPGGALMLHYSRTTISHPHPLAYIEAAYKIVGREWRSEWQIAELPDWVWEKDCQDVFVSDDPSDIAAHIKECRPLLRQEFPRSRAPAFVWHLRSGALVTFYRRIRPFKIEVLRRYLIERSGQDVVVRPWAGSYDDIVAQLWLMPEHWTDRPPEPPGAE